MGGRFMRLIILLLITANACALEFSIDGGMVSYHYGATSYTTTKTVTHNHSENYEFPFIHDVVVEEDKQLNGINNGLGLTLTHGDSKLSLGTYFNSYHVDSNYVAYSYSGYRRRYMSLTAGVMAVTGYGDIEDKRDIEVGPFLSVDLSVGRFVADVILIPGVVAIRPGIKF